MARKARCKICGREISTDVAFKIEGKPNKYYCSETEYNEKIQEKVNEKQRKLDEKNKEQEEKQIKLAERNAFQKQIAEMLNVPFLTPMMLKELNQLYGFYDYAVILKTFKESEKTIQWFLNKSEDSSEYGKAKYIITIIRNNIHKVHKQHLQSLKSMEALFKRDENKTMDIELMNNIINPNTDSSPRKDVTDISAFLD